MNGGFLNGIKFTYCRNINVHMARSSLLRWRSGGSGCLIIILDMVIESDWFSYTSTCQLILYLVWDKGKITRLGKICAILPILIVLGGSWATAIISRKKQLMLRRSGFRTSGTTDNKLILDLFSGRKWVPAIQNDTKSWVSLERRRRSSVCMAATGRKPPPGSRWKWHFNKFLF